MNNTQYSVNKVYESLMLKVVRNLGASFLDAGLDPLLGDEIHLRWTEDLKRRGTVTDFRPDRRVGAFGNQNVAKGPLVRKPQFLLPAMPNAMVPITIQVGEADKKSYTFLAPAAAIPLIHEKKLLDSPDILQTIRNESKRKHGDVVNDLQRMITEELEEAGFEQCYVSPGKSSGGGTKKKSPRKRRRREQKESDAVLDLAAEDSDIPQGDGGIDSSDLEEDDFCLNLKICVENEKEITPIEVKKQGSLKIAQKEKLPIFRGACNDVDQTMFMKFVHLEKAQLEQDIEAKKNTKDVIMCQYEKITQKKSEVKLHIRNGIMSVNGKDYVFGRGVGSTQKFTDE